MPAVSFTYSAEKLQQILQRRLPNVKTVRLLEGTGTTNREERNAKPMLQAAILKPMTVVMSRDTWHLAYSSSGFMKELCFYGDDHSNDLFQSAFSICPGKTLWGWYNPEETMQEAVTVSEMSQLKKIGFKGTTLEASMLDMVLRTVRA